MEPSKFVGMGRLVAELGISNTRIRQLERAGIIPEARRLDPGDRRIYSLDDVDAIKARLEDRRSARQKEVAMSKTA